MLFENSIRSAVMAKIDEKIATVEQEFQDGVVNLRQTKIQEIADAKTRFTVGKEELKNRLVDSIVNKFI